jgi:membrane protein
MTLIGYSSISGEEILTALKSMLPNDVYRLISHSVLEVVNSKRTGLLSISIITTIWTASNGFNAVIRGLNKAYDEKEKRSFIKVQLTAIICTLALIAIIVMAFGLLVFGELGGQLLVENFITQGIQN